MSRESVLVIGAGLMGSQIGCEYAMGGHRVTLLARDGDRLSKRVDDALRSLLEGGLASEELVAAARSRMTYSSPDLPLDERFGLIVESLPEELEVKTTVLHRFAVELPDAIIASNTSSIPIGKLGDAIGAPQRTVGTHYWNPPLLMPPVEVVLGAATAPEIGDRIRAILLGLGKEPVIVARDVPGFIWNRLQLAILREALWLVDNGVATPEGVDVVMRSGLARRSRYTGPFETIAVGGVEAWTSVAENLFPVLSTSTARPDLARWLRFSDADRERIRRRRDAGLIRDLVEQLRRISDG